MEIVCKSHNTVSWMADVKVNLVCRTRHRIRAKIHQIDTWETCSDGHPTTTNQMHHMIWPLCYSSIFYRMATKEKQQRQQHRRHQPRYQWISETGGMPNYPIIDIWGKKSTIQPCFRNTVFFRFYLFCLFCFFAVCSCIAAYFRRVDA